MSPLKSKSKSERNDKAATDSIDKEEAAIASIDGLPSKRDKLCRDVQTRPRQTPSGGSEPAVQRVLRRSLSSSDLEITENGSAT